MIAAIDLATDVLGSRTARKHWLATPALALDGCRPVDLPGGSIQGIAPVRTLLAGTD